MTLLKELSSTCYIVNAHLTRLKNVVSFKTERKGLTPSSSHIRDVARSSVSENNDVVTLKIRILIESIELIDSRLNDVDKQ